MSGQRSGQVLDEYQRPVPGAKIYVFDNGGNTALTYSDAGRTVLIAQPILTDEFGGYTYYAADDFYTEEIWYGGKLRYRERGIPVGAAIGTLEDEALTRANADTAEATTRANADTAETSARIAADNAEVIARNAAILVETNNRITAVSNEAATRAAADLNEANIRSTADTSLSSTIVNEIGNRVNSYNAILALLGGITLTSATLAAADTNALSMLDHSTAQSAVLLDTQRWGLFVPIVANLSTQVAADPSKGIYVAFSTDASGASGAWVRIGVDVYADHFGALGDGISDDSAALNQGQATCNALGIGELKLKPGRKYAAGTTVINAQSNVVITGRGSAITSSATKVYSAGSGVSGHGLRGVELIQTGASDSKYHFDDAGQNATWDDVKLTATPATHAVLGFFRNSTSGLRVNGLRASGANGIFCQGHDNQIHHFDLTNGGGLDDGFVFKAPGVVGTPAQTYNWIIGNGIVRGYGAAFAYGSEIGCNGADDAMRSSYVRNIKIHDVECEQCTSATYLKPGGIIYDYRDGDVEDCTHVNVSLKDLSAINARRFAYFQYSRGAHIRTIRYEGCSCRYRAPNRSGGTNAVFTFLTADYTGGSSVAELDGLYVCGFAAIDPFGGIGNGATTTFGYNGLASGSTVPGYPIDNFFNFDASTGNGGSQPVVKKVVIEGFVGNGCARSPVAVNGNIVTPGGIVGPIQFDSEIFENFAAATLGSADNCAIHSEAKLEFLGEPRHIKAPTAPATTRGFMGDSQTDKTVDYVYRAGVIPIHIGDIPANTTVKRTIVPVKDSWIKRIQIVDQAGIPADATNKLTVTVDNKDTNANLATKNTNTGFALAANTPVSINGTTMFTGANSEVRKGYPLNISVATAGTAVATGLTLLVETLPFGAP